MTENLQNNRPLSLGGADWSKKNNIFTFQGISWSIDEVLKVSLNWGHLNTNGSVRTEEGFTATEGLILGKLHSASGILDGLQLISN
ncbi:hypothetical protein PVK06_018933 [Gossypium arboreum]|uniref:Uncharacterized protein n=1 Tax=Gossypium arboreum TaxID=29729 RepID=A0ABR0PIL2_GOSAR|nr:hypothetical protein PVK06_018933 [Gossypium arboreum]